MAGSAHSPSSSSLVLQMEGISKRFGPVIANDGIDFEARAGEVHALLGENGAGKTTLMNILYGLLQPDAGRILWRGAVASVRSPQDAIALGICMVHQHFQQVGQFTVAENVMLGMKSTREPLLDRSRVEARISELSKQYGLQVDPKAKVWQLSVGARQRVEIIKALYRGAQLLILDEPTSVLTPQETDELFKMLRSMTAAGHTIIFITHKLNEVMALGQRITVLRAGGVVATVETDDTTPRALASMMVGREMDFQLEREPSPIGEIILQVNDLRALTDKGTPALGGLSFSLHEGEILGIAGVDGNGQCELAQVLTGLRPATSGVVYIRGQDMTNCSPRQILDANVAHIPEDRLATGLIPAFSIAENLIIDSHATAPFARSWWMNSGAIAEHAQQQMTEYDVRAPGSGAPCGELSGGNLQKLVLARALACDPALLIAVQPTSGLDVGAAAFVRRRLLEQRKQRRAVLLISADLDEVLALSDRIAVMYRGEIMGVVVREEVNKEQIGLMMAGSPWPIQA